MNASPIVIPTGGLPKAGRSGGIWLRTLTMPERVRQAILAMVRAEAGDRDMEVEL